MTDDKIDQHYRQQLSALMDGALPPDEARFLLRRLQHDVELAQCLDRWHMAGDALRGEAQAIAPAGFAARVAAMVASEPAASPIAMGASRANRGGMRWAGGAALAASVALVALFVSHQPASLEAEQSPSGVAEASIPSGRVTPEAANRSPAATPAATIAESIPMAVVATASLPQRSSIRRGSRSQVQRDTIRTAARSARPMVANAGPQGEGVAANNPFDAATTRPWPSAVFPQGPGAGNFNVDYGNASSPTFYPFAPRLPDEQTRDGGEAQPVDGGPSP